ncbi:MAG: hypothetical protein HYX21_01620 [Candidatus Yanofskybacteria bacterium]|nr:hypothetical protein [Candidatus Yanofskybacteria bacterium]
MSELTKEYLDKQLNKLATKDDIEDVKSLVTEEVGKLAIMTANGFEEIKKDLDVRSEVKNLNRRMSRIEQSLNIKS